MDGIFDMNEQVQGYIRVIEKKDPELLKKTIDNNPKTGPEEVAALLTFLPEERRLTALQGFVMAMLCD